MPLEQTHRVEREYAEALVRRIEIIALYADGQGRDLRR